MASRDTEIRQVADQLETLLVKLRSSVDALNTILLPPEADAGKERIAT